jgi:hypothetical protein
MYIMEVMAETFVDWTVWEGSRVESNDVDRMSAVVSLAVIIGLSAFLPQFIYA